MAERKAILVSAYYRFDASKHGHTKYDSWIRNFLGTVETPIIMFCDEGTRALLLEARGDRPMDLVMLPQSEWETSAPDFEAYWQRDHARDIERHIHNPMLYKIWNEKPFFVERAMRRAPPSPDPMAADTWYVWVDAGCFRSSDPATLATLHNWPHGGAWPELPSVRMTLLQVRAFEERDFAIDRTALLPRNIIDDIRIGGTIMVGSAIAWVRWLTVWRGMLRSYMRANYFTGKDQNLMAAIVVMYPELVNVVSAAPARRDPWFYFQEYLS